MRDIRSDLEERAKLIEAEATRAGAHFEKQIEPLRREYDARVAELKAELAVLNVLMESEQQRMVSGPQPVEAAQQTPKVSETVESELQHIGDRIRKLRDREPAPVARSVSGF
jgi:hypothetical protein